MPSPTERVEVLRSVNLFSQTPDYVLADIAALFKPLTYRAGETVFEKGDTGDCMYIIASGKVCVQQGQQVLDYMGTGDAFGEMALLDSYPRSATIVAKQETELWQLSQEAFYDLMATRPEVARGVIRVLSHRLRARLNNMAEDYEYIQQVQRITAAAASLERGVFDLSGIEEITHRKDALGPLARVFSEMARTIYAREQDLRRQVEELRILVDEGKKAREVAAITETEYFHDLVEKAAELRQRKPPR